MAYRKKYTIEEEIQIELNVYEEVSKKEDQENNSDSELGDYDLYQYEEI